MAAPFFPGEQFVVAVVHCLVLITRIKKLLFLLLLLWLFDIGVVVVAFPLLYRFLAVVFVDPFSSLLTFACSVWSSENGALFYVSKRLDQLPNIVLRLLFA